MSLKLDPEFNELEKYGFVSEYVKIEDGVVYPTISATEALTMFHPKGTKLALLKEMAYLSVEDIISLFEGKELIVSRCLIGRDMAYYEFEGIPSKYNSVMFDLQENIKPKSEVSYEAAFNYISTLKTPLIADEEVEILNFIEDSLFRLEGLEK